MKKLFGIAIGFDETDQKHVAIVHSVTDNKVATVEDTSARLMLAKLNKLIRAKTRQVKNFPIPEPKRIITLNGKGDRPRLIVPARN